MYSGALSLLEVRPDIQLAVASLYNGDKLLELNIKNITYYLLPGQAANKQYQPQLEPLWQQIKQGFTPDVVHIHGTEYPHGMSYLKACGKNNVVISIQGLVSVYERYFLGGISERDIKANITVRDIIKRDSLFKQRRDFQRRGKFEQEYIKTVEHVIGRTSWDAAHVKAIHPEVNYHFCNETLRGEFYEHEWRLEECDKHSIFLSQAHYPIKGLHQVLKALPFILKRFPDTNVFIAGSNFINNAGLKLNGYAKYVLSLIKELGVEKQLHFTGILSASEMRSRYLRSHVFVCPSSIENSPNSVGEAQLLGLPCVAAYVGGVPDMIEDGENGLLYRFEEVEMLAEEVCRIFSDNGLAMRFSASGREAAHKRHSRTANAQNLIDIYSNVCKSI